MNTVTLARGFVKNSLEKNPTIGHWLAFSEVGKVTLRVGKVNFGQGISTALTQIAAEELDIALAQIILAPINTQDSPDEGVTSGSFSIEHCGEAVRMACATIKAVAIARFCSASGSPAASVAIQDGVISSSETTHVMTYWDLNLNDQLSEKVLYDALQKPQSDHRLVGTPVARMDLERKLFGGHSFIQDMVIPGMQHCRILRAPNRAGRIVNVDEAGFHKRFSDVELLRDGSFIGVIAAREEVAVAAISHLETLVTWHLPASLPNCADLRTFLTSAPSEQRIVGALETKAPPP